MAQPRTPLRILIADDHSLVRSGLVSLLEDLPAVEIVGEFDDGDELVEHVARLAPDLVITDISMQRVSGLVALRQMREAQPDLKVLILSMYDSAEFVQQALAGGACGYLLKDSATVELQLAIEAVRAGHTYLSPRISTRLVEQLKHGGSMASTPGSAHLQNEPAAVEARAVSPLLTPRQVEILTLIAGGKALKEIAFELGLSIKTVETHRSMLMDRLGIRDVAGLVHYAVRHGLVQLRGGEGQPR